MADLAGFARRIQRRAQRIEARADDTVIKAAVLADATVVIATPVDTGRARANWTVGIDAADTEATDNTDKSGNATIGRNNSEISKRKSGQTIFISNNVEYIGFLNAGSSSQAPANFVQKAVQAAQAFIRSRRLVQ